MEILQNLNPMQLKAATHKDGPQLIIAGAGSGKTRVLTVRIANLITVGVEPWNILAITFTNKAAREMKERIEALTQSSSIWVATFHSTCIRILKRDIDKIGYSKSFSIYDTSDQESLIKNAIKKFNLDDKQFSAKGVLHEIGRQKDELVTWQQYKEQAEFDKDYRKIKIALVFEEYQRQLTMSNALDFDDIIMKTVELFVKSPDVLEKYQNRFKYILVDEYQDTNTAQYKLISLLASKYKNLCVVGDDDQSIYGWRGANINNILNFEKDYPNAFVVKLEQNYRSTGTILDAANEVIKHNIGRKGKTLWTQNEAGVNISVDSLQNEYDEAYFCIQQIADNVKNGKSYKDFAFLFRTNAQTRVVEDSLIKHNIPYRLYGGTRFYDRKEIKDILAYLRLINNITDNVALRRIINVPRRGIGDSSLERVAMYADAEERPMYEILSNVDKIPELKSRATRIKDFVSTIDHLRSVVNSVSVVELIDTMLITSRYMAELKQDISEEGRSRVENVYELINKATDYEKNAEEPSFEGFLEEVALVADIDAYSQDNDMVSLMTLHSAKGLEFPVVFMCGAEEGLFPSFRSIMSGSPKELEEERRLCYVGITRAKEKLYITYAKSRMHMGQTQYNSISRFIKDIPEKYLTGNTVKKEIKPKKTAASVPTSPPATPAAGVRSFAQTTKKPQYNYSYNLTTPKSVKIDFSVGDYVTHSKYGKGLVEDIKPAGADYEVAVTFGDTTKKFMANLAKLKKV